MILKEKIVCCHGNLTAKSTAKILKTTLRHVYFIWDVNDLPVIKKGYKR